MELSYGLSYIVLWTASVLGSRCGSAQTRFRGNSRGSKKSLFKRRPWCGNRRFEAFVHGGLVQTVSPDVGPFFGGKHRGFKSRHFERCPWCANHRFEAFARRPSPDSPRCGAWLSREWLSRQRAKMRRIWESLSGQPVGHQTQKMAISTSGHTRHVPEPGPLPISTSGLFLWTAKGHQSQKMAISTSGPTV